MPKGHIRNQYKEVYFIQSGRLVESTKDELRYEANLTDIDLDYNEVVYDVVANPNAKTDYNVRESKTLATSVFYNAETGALSIGCQTFKGKSAKRILKAVKAAKTRAANNASKAASQAVLATAAVAGV